MQITRAALLAPDRTYIKLAAYVKAALDMLLMLVRQPNRRTLHQMRLVLTVKPWYSMLSAARLVSLYQRALDVRGVPGDVVECGVWRGGGLAMMGAGCADAGDTRQLWAFDSFQGLPPPSDNDTPDEHQAYHAGLNLGDPDMVRMICHRLGQDPHALHIIPGWFQDTLPTAPVEQIALLHADGDWYDSVRIVLDTLYDRVSPGGAVVVDDYAYWEGARRALDDFLDAHGLPLDVLHHDAAPAAYFFKPES